MMKILLHTCCAPCSVYCLEKLKNEGFEPTIFWFNPNIHPYTEYKARRDCLKKYAESLNIPILVKENYGLDNFCKNVIDDLGNRCVNYCYRARIGETARFAKNHGFEAFSTTLLVSPYQKHEELKVVCEDFANLTDTKFIYYDFREGFREGQNKARELGLYMQKYCGCIFSEEDRYRKQIERDLKEAKLC